MRQLRDANPFIASCALKSTKDQPIYSAFKRKILEFVLDHVTRTRVREIAIGQKFALPKLERTDLTSSRYMSANTTPLPSTWCATISPHGSTIIVWPKVRRPLG